jgi:hypothetical protein
LTLKRSCAPSQELADHFEQPPHLSRRVEHESSKRVHDGEANSLLLMTLGFQRQARLKSFTFRFESWLGSEPNASSRPRRLFLGRARRRSACALL